MSRLITNRQARRHFMALQALCEPPHRAWGSQGLARTIERLGFVQVDSINVVERAHHHILFSRNQTYRQPHLAALVERERSMFENWTHDAAIIPTAFFPYWKHRFAKQRTWLRQRWKSHFDTEGFDLELERVRERIARDGAVMAREFEGDKPNTGWWDWHPAKAALEYLWRTGELAIARRDGFQKVYDFAERVVPPEHFIRTVSRQEFVDWACRSALERLGFATRGEIAAFWALLTPAEVEEWLRENSGALETVRIETHDGSKPRQGFALPGTADAALKTPTPPARLRVLNPFDPLLRDRARAERLFGFSYRIEVFVPEAKRKYGYYVYPVMRGDTMIGRIDMKADRNADTLSVRAFWPEARARLSRIAPSGLEAELERLRRFSGVGRVKFVDGWLRDAPPA